MASKMARLPRRMTWEEWHLGQIVQLHALLARDLGDGGADALRGSFNWQTVFAMTTNQPVGVERRHAQELAAGVAGLAETWDEFSKRQPPLDEVSAERKVERERQRQHDLERQRDHERKWDAVTLEEVWPLVVKASLGRRQDPDAWRIIAATADRCVRRIGAGT